MSLILFLLFSMIEEVKPKRPPPPPIYVNIPVSNSISHLILLSDIMEHFQPQIPARPPVPREPSPMMDPDEVTFSFSIT